MWGKLARPTLVGMARRAVRLLSTDALSAGLGPIHEALSRWFWRGIPARIGVILFPRSIIFLEGIRSPEPSRGYREGCFDKRQPLREAFLMEGRPPARPWIALRQTQYHLLEIFGRLELWQPHQNRRIFPLFVRGRSLTKRNSTGILWCARALRARLSQPAQAA